MKWEGTLIYSIRYSVAIISIFVGAAKLYSACGTANIVDYPGGLFQISDRNLFIGAALVQFFAASYLFIAQSHFKALLVVRWLAGSFIFYRISIDIVFPGSLALIWAPSRRICH